MRTLMIGSRGADVMFLQVLLNRNGANPQVVEDGVFGRATQVAVAAYQRAKGIAPADGAAGAMTRASFGPLREVHHRVTPFGQPDHVTCWSAAATIMLGNRSVGAGSARTGTDGGLGSQIDNVEQFLRSLGWHMVNNGTSPSASSLIRAVQRGPLWVSFVGTENFGHAVVISGYHTNAAGDEDATVFDIQDPWPPGRGAAYPTTYRGRQAWLRNGMQRRPAAIQYAAQP